MAEEPEHYTFADLRWQSRWNAPEAIHVSLYQSGPTLIATGCMGVLHLNLTKPADQVAVVAQLRQLAKAIEAAQLRYTTVATEHNWTET